MNMYQWEHVEEPYYIFGVYSQRTVGLVYDVLHVEETVEGHHGILLMWQDADHYGPDDYDPAGLAMVDERVFDDAYSAKVWCEEQDRSRSGIGSDVDAEVAYWDEIMNEGSDYFDEIMSAAI